MKLTRATEQENVLTMLIVAKVNSTSNAKNLSIEEEVLNLARRPKGVTREEATRIIGKDVYAAFQR